MTGQVNRREAVFFLNVMHFVLLDSYLSVSSRTGFPNDPAAEIALDTVRDWLRENKDKVSAVHFSENQLHLCYR